MRDNKLLTIWTAWPWEDTETSEETIKFVIDLVILKSNLRFFYLSGPWHKTRANHHRGNYAKGFNKQMQSVT